LVADIVSTICFVR